MTCECGVTHKPDSFWLRYGERVVTCQGCGKTSTAHREHQEPVGPAVIDDTLPGGARWMQNLDHTPLWVETKTELKQELDKRGLRLRDSDNVNKNDKSPWATRTRLR